MTRSAVAAEWQTPLAAFESHLQRAGRSPLTIRTWAGVVAKLSREVEDDGLGPWSVTGHRLADWFAGRDLSTASQKRVTVALRAFYSWGIDRGYLDRSPVAALGAVGRPGPTPRRLPHTWDRALAEFLGWLAAGGRGVSTRTTYRQRLLRLAGDFSDPWSITADELAGWLADPTWTAETRRGARGTVQAFYRWAVRTGRAEANPAEDLLPVRVPRGLPRPCPDHAIAEALSECDDRMRLALLLSALAGMRRAEVAGLRWADVADTVRVTGKGGHVRSVPVHPTLSEALSAERARRYGGQVGSGWTGSALRSPFVFPGRAGPVTAQHMGVLVARALPSGWTMHTLRHRFATAAYGAQRDLRAVQELLGHAKPETTARYAAVPDGARLAAVQAAGIGGWR